MSSIGIVFVVATAIVAATCATACDSCVDDHAEGYETLRSQVTECDTLGFYDAVCRLRQQMRHGTTDSAAIIDADILTAWKFAQSSDCDLRARDSAIFYADHVINTLSKGTAMSYNERMRQMADMEFIKGDAFYHAARTDSCYYHLQKSLNYARDAGYSHRIVKICGLLAKVGCKTQDWQGVMLQIRSAEFVLDTVSLDEIEPPCRMLSLAECAGVAIDLCCVDVADRLLTKASLIYDKASDRSKMWYLRQIVRLRFFLHQYSQAATAMSKLEMLIDKTGYNVHQSDAVAFQGLARCRLGQVGWAEECATKIDTQNLSHEGRLVFDILRGEICAIQKNFDCARAYLFDSVPQDSELTLFDWAMVNESRCTYWVVQGNYEEAYNVLTDERRRGFEMQNDVFSVNNRQREAELTQIENKRDTERAAKEERESNTIEYIIILALILTTVIGYAHVRMRGVRIKAMNDTKRLQEELQKKMAEFKQQTQYIEVTNKRISESIQYAQHIQQSITPSPESLNDYPISGSLVFLSPLDVVSGDFFWFTRKGDKLVICCADCTGHGVPGAFMSMVSATIINSICDRLSEEELDPATMLEMLDGSIIENLSHNKVDGEATKDGLDAALVVLDLNTHVFKAAAARRPIIVSQGDDMFTIRGTKRSIGDIDTTLHHRKFETTTLEMSTGDTFYIYTDGYSDQFGGQNGEKLKNSRIEKFLKTIRDDSMDEQILTVQEFFTQWKGDYPQTDDVLFVGIKI